MCREPNPVGSVGSHDAVIAAGRAPAVGVAAVAALPADGALGGGCIGARHAHIAVALVYLGRGPASGADVTHGLPGRCRRPACTQVKQSIALRQMQ